MKGTIVKKGNKIVGVQIGGQVFEGGEDENGVFIWSTCNKCGKDFKNYLKGRGLISSICPDCKALKGKMRVEGDTLVIGRVRVKVKKAE